RMSPSFVKSKHLTRRRLRRFLEKQHSPEEENEILLHLFAVCPGCRAAGGPLLDLVEHGVLQPAFSSLDVDLELSRAAAPALWEQLKSFSSDRRKNLVQTAKRFRSWGLCELLCEESVRLAASDAVMSVHVAELAVLISSR